MNNKAIFLDRDGVINIPIVINNKPYAPTKFKDFKLFDNLRKTLSYLKLMNYLLIIITNQPEISRNNISQKTMQKMNNFIHKKLPINEIIICPCSESSDCDCYKPKPEMLYNAKAKYKLNLNECFFVGDTWRDVECAKNAGCKSILMIKEYNINLHSKADYLINSFDEILQIVK